jgi:hypothetical protein
LLLAPGRQGVKLTDQGRLDARYGFLVLDTPLTNIADAHITGPYRWWTALGPPLARPVREPESWQRRDHDMKRILGLSTVLDRIDEGSDRIQELHDRPRPAVS